MSVDAGTSPVAKPVVRVRPHRPWLVVAAVALVAAAAGGYALYRHYETAVVTQYVTAPVSVGPITRVVSTTGTVNPELTIIVGSYVSGVITALHCDYNTEVKTGQICAKIDPRPYQTAVDQARANLAVAKAQLQKDEASLSYAKRNYERNAKLVQSNAVSADAYDNAKSNYDQALAQVAYDQATIDQRQAALDAAEVNLGYTDIQSPVDGTVVSRNVTVGQTVAASFQTPTLFLIASDLAKMQVDTNVSEGDIGEIRNGNKALFSVDAFPNRTFEGKVSQIRQSPQTVQNVVTYDVVVSIDNRDLALMPGMTASVRVVTDQRDRVLRVPSQALRYTPENALPTDPDVQQVWVRRGAQLVPVKVTPGLSDDNFTEIADGDLKPGDQVVLSERATPRNASAPRLRL